jgi:hypothetical protein
MTSKRTFALRRRARAASEQTRSPMAIVVRIKLLYLYEEEQFFRMSVATQ